MEGVAHSEPHATEENLLVQPSLESVPKRRRSERTPHQIARKRHQDREAQRQSRERTRRRIEEGENRLAESHAAAAKYERELKRVIEEKDAARIEVSNLKEQLQSVCSQLEAVRARLSSLVNFPNMNNIHPETLGSTSLGLPSVPVLANKRRELLRRGGAKDEVLGPRNPNLSVLPLLGNRPQGNVKYPLSHMISKVMSKLHLSRPIPEQVAFLWTVHLSLRWNILPSRPNWEALPEYIRPVHSQVVVAHPVWLDHVPWPDMRSILSERSGEFSQNDFILPFWEDLSVNWPYDAWDTITKDETTGEIVISPAFEEHIRIPENWSLGPEFARKFPVLTGSYRCH
ncbi:hypothetical protein BDV97DRAFT_372434 [Delphinella strobiligena]|nr:hypothetical protein BDV97DRAFT_372434 [Delphinella strobiligena]